MAAVDVQVQNYVKTICFPVIILLIAVRIFRRPIKRIKKKLFAWALNIFALRIYNKRVKSHKETLFKGLKDQAQASDRRLSVLEIGAGSGANFAFFPANVNVTCLDPNVEFIKYAKENVDINNGVNMVEYVVGVGEDMSAIPSGSVDAVVSTLVLCSVNNTDAVLKEVKRILRVGGKFYYMEHVAAEEGTFLHKIQRLTHPVQKMCGGCEVMKKTHTNIETAGFAEVNLEHFYVRLPIIGSHISGTATK